MTEKTFAELSEVPEARQLNTCGGGQAPCVALGNSQQSKILEQGWAQGRTVSSLDCKTEPLLFLQTIDSQHRVSVTHSVRSLT